MPSYDADHGGGGEQLFDPAGHAGSLSPLSFLDILRALIKPFSTISYPFITPRNGLHNVPARPQGGESCSTKADNEADNRARGFFWEVPEQVVPKLGMPTVSRFSDGIRENQGVIESWNS